MSSVAQAAPQASSPQMNIPMSELGKKRTTTFEELKKSVIAEFGETKINEFNSAKEAIKSLKHKNIQEGFKCTGGVIGAFAIAALALAAIVGFAMLSNAFALPLIVPIALGLASFLGGTFGSTGFGVLVATTALENIEINNEAIEDNKTKTSKIYDDLKIIINKKTHNSDERNRLFDAVINEIQMKK